MPNSPEKKKNEKIITISLSIEIIKQNGQPAIQLRKVISDKEVIKEICARALKDQFIPAKIEFRDKFYAATKLKASKLI